MARPARWLMVVLLGMALTSAFAVVLVTYQTRVQFAELEQLRQRNQQLDEQWGRLLLEESAFSSPSRVERLARDKLQMSEPGEDQVRWLDLSQP